jgi:hypothetical protein
MTKTIPADLRKAAKTMAREQGIPHQTALDVLARKAGHSCWGALLASRRIILDPFRSLVLDLWNAGGTDLHIEPWHPTGIVQSRSDDRRTDGPLTHRERHVLLSQLSTMMIAGVDVAVALRAIREHHGERIAEVATALEISVASGADLAQTMFEDDANFPDSTGLMIKTGATGPGGTAQALKRAAQHQELLIALAADPSYASVQADRPGAKILFRIHGRRRLISTMDAAEFNALQAAVAPCLFGWEDHRPADGIVGMEIDGVKHAFRVATAPSEGSSKIVVRVPDRWTADMGVERLGIRDLDAWMRICRSGPGIVIVSGKTCSGKSTTIDRTIRRLRSEGIDAIAEEDNLPFREDRVVQMVEAAKTRTVLLEAFGSSLDRAIANAMTMGLDNADLARLFRGGMHQELHVNVVGPRTLDTVVMPWG